jgi:hypothetical protein
MLGGTAARPRIASDRPQWPARERNMLTRRIAVVASSARAELDVMSTAIAC